MKKIALIFTLLMFTAGMAYGADIMSEESFETAVPPTNWVGYEVDGDAWEQTSVRAHTGDNSAYHDDSYIDNDAWLITPGVDISGYTNQQLVYWENVNWSSYADEHNVKISTNYSGSGDPTSATWTALNTTIGTEDTWVEKTFDISGYSGTVYIAFQYVGNGASEWYIDDVAITGEQPGAPGEPTNPSPADDATGIATSGDITWDFGADTDTYDLWFGEAGSMTQVVTGATAGATGSYSYSGLSNTTEYEWQVICHNSTKLSTDGPVWSFTTEFNWVTQTIPFTEDFEGTLDIWFLEGTTTPEISTSQFHGGSSSLSFNTTSSTNSSVTVQLDSATDPMLTFWYYIDYYYYNDLTVDIKEAGASTWTTAIWQQATTSSTDDTWLEANVDLTSYDTESGAFRLRFNAENTYGYSDYIVYMDDVNVQELTGPPNPATLVSPLDEATDVVIGTDLEWNASLNTDGYKLYFGSDGGGTSAPTNLVNGSDLGDVLVYDHPSDLAYSTTYYWQIVPYNGDGDATSCPIWSFTTMDDPTVTTYPYTENFDGTWSGDPAAPLGWKVINADNDSYTWEQDDTYITPHSGDWVAHGMGNQDDYLITPPLDLTGKFNARIKWWDVVESASENNTYKVLVSTTTNDITAFTDSLGNYNCTNTTWTEHVLDLSAYSGETIYVAFYQYYSASTAYGFGIDDVTIEEIPSAPVFAISPTSKDFGTVNVGTTSDTTYFTISNDGAETLTVTGVDITGTDAAEFTLDDTNSYNVDLGAGEEMYVGVAFAPTTIGEQTANLQIIDDLTKTTHDIPLTGTGWDVNYGGGGTGQGGYYFANSTGGASGAPSQPSYNWIDISTTGTDVYGDLTAGDGYAPDDATGYPIGFTFNYFGTDYTHFWVGADGFIKFGSGDGDFSNDGIPNSAEPNDIIALFWDDLNPSSPIIDEAAIYYQSFSDYLVITYEKIEDYTVDNAWFTAQIVLYSSGNIKLQYKETGGSMPLDECTVGIENAAGDAGVQYLYDGTGGDIYSVVKADEIAVMFGTDENTLPVELIAGSLTAQFATENDHNFVNLSWATASETDLQGFNVYRASTIDLSVANQVNVTLIPGAGNSTETQEYSFADITADVYVNSYYWLEMVDLDGNSFYGPVTYNPQEQEIPENIETTILRNCQPNPVRDEVSIAYQIKGSPSEQNAELRVYNIQGRLVKTVNSDNGIFEFSTSNLSTGIYFYQLKTESFNQIRKMVITK